MDGRNVDLVEETIYHTSLKKKEHIFILLKQWIKPQNGKLRVTICLHLLLGLTPEDRHTSINWAGFHSTSTSDIKWDERQRDPAFWLRSAVQHHYFKKKKKIPNLYTWNSNLLFIGLIETCRRFEVAMVTSSQTEFDYFQAARLLWV